jgi:protein-disulfide isomerase/uncharacterized membrane protein
MFKNQTDKPIKPLSYAVYYVVILVLAIGGLADSIYLSISHFRIYNDLGYSSFCAISRSINCDTVSQSPQAILWGLPLPVWGVIAYLFYLLLLATAWRADRERHRLWPLLFLMALGFSVHSVYLALVSTFKIRSYCVMCIVDYGINFALLYFTWLVRKRFQGPGLLSGIQADVRFLFKGAKKSGIVMLGAWALLAVATVIFFPRYWQAPPPLVSSHVATGTTADGHPWIGAAEPEIVVTEFTDYQCFQCNKFHYYLRQIVAKKPNKIRLVHRHFPMDHRVNPLIKKPYHVRAGPLALMAIYAAQKGRFWPMNDYLFLIARDEAAIRFEDVAQKVGLDVEGLKQALVDPVIRKKLKKDIHDGIRLGIEGTPGFIIEGQVYNALLPPEVIKKLLE